jgi:hypothetical protein
MRRAFLFLSLLIALAAAQPTAEELEAQCLTICDQAQESCSAHDVRCDDQCDGATNTTIENVTAMRDAIAGSTNDAHTDFFCQTMFIASGSHVVPTLTLPKTASTGVGYTMAVLFIALAVFVGFAAGWCFYARYKGKMTASSDDEEDRVKLTKPTRGGSRSRTPARK